MLLQVATKVQLEIYIKHTRLILKNSHEDEHEDGLKKIIKEFKKNRAHMSSVRWILYEFQ